MNRQRKTSWLASVAVVLLLAVLPLACGGGGGTNPAPPGISAAWTPDNPNPGNTTISMGAGNASASNFAVPVQVTGIDNFFGAAFTVTFDPASAAFVSFSDAGSVIDDGNSTVLINATAGAAGEVLVNATRQQEPPGGNYVPGVDVGATSLLITLNFRATVATGGNAFAFAATEVQTCADPPGDTCQPLGGVTYSGGTMTAN